MKLQSIREAVNHANYQAWIEKCKKLHPEADVIEDENGAKINFTTGSISHLVGMWDHRGGKGVVYGAYKQPGELNDTLQDVD